MPSLLAKILAFSPIAFPPSAKIGEEVHFLAVLCTEVIYIYLVIFALDERMYFSFGLTVAYRRIPRS